MIDARPDTPDVPVFVPVAMMKAAPDLLAALSGLISSRLGARTLPQGGDGDSWKVWADRFRDDPKVDRPLLDAVDALARAEGRDA